MRACLDRCWSAASAANYRPQSPVCPEAGTGIVQVADSLVAAKIIR